MLTFEPRRPGLPGLTSLRFFAAGAVLLAHLESGGVPLLPHGGGAGAGYAAVTFFFVLSGFILAYVYSGPHETGALSVPWTVFLAARFARIGPAYYLGLALALPVFLYRSFVLHLMPPESCLAALLLAPLMLQAWYPPAALAWNAPAWSLSVELFFYLLFPLLLWQAGRLARGRFLVLAACAVIATAVARHVYPVTQDAEGTRGWAAIAYAHPLFHLASFVFGMALGRLFLFGPVLSRRAHDCLFAGGALGLALALAGLPGLPWWSGTDASLVPLFGLVIFGAARRGTFVERALSLPWLVGLGEASFSIYILHAGLIFWFHWILQRAAGIPLAGAADYVVTCGFVLAASVVVHRSCERPLRQWILSRAHNRPTATEGSRVSSPNG